MGFHVRIADDSLPLVRLITTDPSKVLGQLYAAYLFFLVGDRDEVQLKWLLDSAKALDSLTGKYLAYAVFAKAFPIRLSTDSFPGDRTPRNVGQANASVLMSPASVSRLVKDGTFGRVVDGDEITAITYGTDMVAEELGLIGRLPCLLILDAIPTGQPKVIPLDKEVIPALFGLLRSAIARFHSVDGHTSSLAGAKGILELQAKIESENQRDATLRRNLSREREKLQALRSKIARGQQTRDPTFLQDIAASRERVVATLDHDLQSFSVTHEVRLQELELELARAMNEYRRKSERLFSNCFATELHAQGMKSKLGVAKAKSISVLAGLFKPEVLIKLWGVVP